MLFSVADDNYTGSGMGISEVKLVNPRKAAGPGGIPFRVVRACAEQLAGVFKDILNLSLS